MTGEMQRLIPDSNATGYDKSNKTSNDGWALAGAATLFTTAVAGEDGDTGQTGGMNNGFFESSGSEHPGGAHLAWLTAPSISSPTTSTKTPSPCSAAWPTEALPKCPIR